MCAANSNYEITIFESDPIAREQIADNMTEDQIDQAVLTNLLHLDLSWDEKQAILSSCIRNPCLIESMANQWFNDKLISQEVLVLLTEEALKLVNL
ncbi:MAG: hypothetical protein ACTSYA_10330 [Candidatus Kariarchaeaceae archaeon]